MTEDSLLHDGTRKILLSDDQFRESQALMRQFYMKTKCPAIVLTDASGLLISHCGTISSQNLVILSTLAAASYSATKEMARLIGENESFKVHFHEGTTNNLYVSGVTDNYSLVIVFAKTTTFGMVRVLAEKTIVDLEKILKRENSQETFQTQNKQIQQSMLSKEFQEELTDKLDSIFGQFKTPRA